MAPHSTVDSDYSSGSYTPTSTGNDAFNGLKMDPQEPIAIIGMGKSSQRPHL